MRDKKNFSTMRKTNIDTEDSEMQNCTAEENNGDSEGQPDFCELGSSLKSKVQEFSRTVPNILLMQLLITRGCITILNWNDELRELFADHIFEKSSLYFTGSIPYSLGQA
ncbi:unnamed protein product [Allacma fusca]|uniref:Uncharacterized protein n=2 Tax=Allacma fusca TaxID=39272 RepID=A0A8J2LF95_9HEXA|nr:unnamed protein product [Allacma fusca]